MNKLENHGGRFTSLLLYRVKQGITKHCAKILRYSPSSVRFLDVNSGKVTTVPRFNVIEPIRFKEAKTGRSITLPQM